MRALPRRTADECFDAIDATERALPGHPATRWQFADARARRVRFSRFGEAIAERRLWRPGARPGSGAGSRGAQAWPVVLPVLLPGCVVTR